MSLLTVRGLTKRFGGFIALDTVDVEVREGERLGLIGPNGSGKSTLVNCISGLLRNDAGTISFAGAEIQNLAAWQRTRLGWSHPSRGGRSSNHFHSSWAPV